MPVSLVGKKGHRRKFDWEVWFQPNAWKPDRESRGALLLVEVEDLRMEVSILDPNR